VDRAGEDAVGGGFATPSEPTVKQVNRLLQDLLRPRPAVYYADLLASAGVAWGALLASGASQGIPSAVLFAIGVLALYRGGCFIHEVTHLRPGAVPGFSVVWNALLGVPLLMPSLLYVGVHSIHHARAHYGTARDPEYLPIGTWPAWKVTLWILHAVLLLVAPPLRFLVLGPASLLHPRLRAWVWGKASSLAINPSFTRAPPPAGLRATFAAQEVACCVWALAVVVLTASGVFPVRSVLRFLAAGAALGLLNQLRTAISHRFRNPGRQLSFEEQFLDSINVPGNPVLSELWGPVGLRYHALHHLLPALPYHALGAAHRRLAAVLPRDAAYHRTVEPTLAAAFQELLGPAHAT
jgi:fatty acid desaturase